ncbi:unnamed protein product [Penicillium manginii]
MNSIREVQKLNKLELENAVPPEASWHADYRDTAYIYIGGLPFDLSEGDIVTIFSQYGEPVNINLVRDKETGKSRGFAFLKYEDQRSTDLAVDNMGGATVMGRMLRVDHTRYKKRDDDEEGDNVAKLMGDAVIDESKKDDEDRSSRRKRIDNQGDKEEQRPLLKEEKELQDLIQNHDEEDPMKEFLIGEKKEEVALAIEKYQNIPVAIALVPPSGIVAIVRQTEIAKEGRAAGLQKETTRKGQGETGIERLEDLARHHLTNIAVIGTETIVATEKLSYKSIYRTLSLHYELDQQLAMYTVS